MDLVNNWSFLGDFSLRGSGELPYAIFGRAIRIATVARTPPTWFRAGVVCQTITGLDFNGRLEKRPIVLNTDNIIVWDNALSHSYGLFFYPYPWVKGFRIQFFLYQLLEPNG